MRRLRIACIVAVLLLSACASVQERQAVERLRKLETSRRFAGDRPDAFPLPDLSQAHALKDYLTYAALNNPALEASFNLWKAALERLPQARALPDPRFTYAYYIKEVETRVGPQKQRIGIAQTFPWLGKLDATRDVALEESNVAWQQFEMARLRLRRDVKNAYFEHYYIHRAIRTAEENVQLLAYLETVSRARYATGGTAQSDVIKAQVERSRLEDRLASLRDLVDPARARFNAALGREAAEPVHVPERIEAPNLALEDEAILARAEEENPELRILEYRTAREEAAVRVAEWKYFPEPTLGLEYIDTHRSSMPMVEDNGKDPIIATISFNVPIWWGKYRAAVREAEARRDAARRDRADRHNTLVADLKMGLFNFRDAQRRLSLYRDTLVPMADQSLVVTRQAYETGKVPFSDLIDAQRILIEFQLSFERAVTDSFQRLADIDMWAGGDVADIGSEAAGETEMDAPHSESPGTERSEP
ncbi:TolC family protein [Candidatus Sumerlaeota bacterium]|nr:TolC family protein [Candidatus Sumerlaeota bacterium]